MIKVAGPTLEQLEKLSVKSDYAIFRAAGDCMEGLGIPDGSYGEVCFRRFPRPDRHDPCFCWLNYMGIHYAGIKEYIGVRGTMQMVGTRYKNRPNWTATADRIFGVVFACWDSTGRLLWRRELIDYPTEGAAV